MVGMKVEGRCGGNMSFWNLMARVQVKGDLVRAVVASCIMGCRRFGWLFGWWAGRSLEWQTEWGLVRYPLSLPPACLIDLALAHNAPDRTDSEREPHTPDVQRMLSYLRTNDRA